MNKLSLTFILLSVLLSTDVFSQTATPTPPQTDEKDVVKISTTLIQVDVTVTDKKGNPVADLNPEDFDILENGEKQDIWKKISLEAKSNSNLRDNILLDTTSRQFRRGTVTTYSFVIYNARTDSAEKLQFQARLFHNGKLLKEGAPIPVDVSGQKDLRRIEVTDAVTLGTDLRPGEYALQVVVSDDSAKQKNRIATQWIDFEIIN